MRPKTLTRAQFQLVLSELGVRLDTLRAAVETAESFERCEELVEDFKRTTRRALKRRIFLVHPDRNRRPDAKERTQALTGVWGPFLETLETLKARPPRSTRQREVIVSHRYDFVAPPRGFTAAPPTSEWAQRVIDDALRRAVGDR